MIKNSQYKDFSLRIHEKGACKPIVGQFELTHRCNLRCRHCYLLPGVGNQGRRELTYKELCHIFDEVYREGCLWLSLTGGELLLRKDFLDIYSYAHGKGFILTLPTNATLLTGEIVRYLERLLPFSIEVTLNAVTKGTYELISQTPGSFEQAVQGIKLLRKHKLPLKLKCQAMTLNIDEFPLMRKFGRKERIRFDSSALIDPRADGSTEPCSLRLPVEKLIKLKRRKVLWKEDNEVCASPAFTRLFHCPGGTWMFYVSPLGELFFCNSARKLSWDLSKHSFRQGFHNFFQRIRALEFKTASPCKRCDLRLRKICLW